MNLNLAVLKKDFAGEDGNIHVFIRIQVSELKKQQENYNCKITP